MLISILLLGAGLVMLYGGGAWLVRGAGAVALRAGMSPFIVGMTVVAFATSAPELMVSLTSAWEGVDDVAVGNVVGSNIANIGLVLALSLLVRPVRIEAKILRSDMPLLLLVTLFVVWVFIDGHQGRLESMLLLFGLALFILHNVRLSRGESEAVLEEFSAAAPRRTPGLVNSWLLILMGVGLLVGGGAAFLEGAIRIAETAGVSTGLIGLTVVAVGTSLPELATSIVASFRGEGDIAIGNVIGSNFFNLLCVLGITGLISPLHAGSIQTLDLMVMTGMTALLLPLMYSGFRVNRLEGLLLAACYGGYLWLLSGRLAG